MAITENAAKGGARVVEPGPEVSRFLLMAASCTLEPDLPLSTLLELHLLLKRKPLDRVVEWGVGGSSVLLRGGVRKRYVGIDTDASWLFKVRAAFTNSFPSNRGTEVSLVHINMGEVGLWGYPTTCVTSDLVREYAMQDSESDNLSTLFVVDGRFRVNCLLACAARAKPEDLIFIDDYRSRSIYWLCETFLTRVSFIDRGCLLRLAQENPRPSLDLIGSDWSPS
jgi:hypothetical protein